MELVKLAQILTAMTAILIINSAINANFVSVNRMGNVTLNYRNPVKLTAYIVKKINISKWVILICSKIK